MKLILYDLCAHLGPCVVTDTYKVSRTGHTDHLKQSGSEQGFRTVPSDGDQAKCLSVGSGSSLRTGDS